MYTLCVRVIHVIRLYVLNNVLIYTYYYLLFLLGLSNSAIFFFLNSVFDSLVLRLVILRLFFFTLKTCHFKRGLPSGLFPTALSSIITREIGHWLRPTRLQPAVFSALNCVRYVLFLEQSSPARQFPLLSSSFAGPKISHRIFLSKAISFLFSIFLHGIFARVRRSICFLTEFLKLCLVLILYNVYLINHV